MPPRILVTTLVLLCLAMMAAAVESQAKSSLFQGVYGIKWFTHKSQVPELSKNPEATRMTDLFQPEVFVRKNDPATFLDLPVKETYYYFDQEQNKELAAGAGKLGLVEIRFPRSAYERMVKALTRELGQEDQSTIYNVLWRFPGLRVEVRKYGGAGFYFDEAPDLTTSVGVVYIEPLKEGVEPAMDPILREK
jgi:hypothetical protein